MLPGTPKCSKNVVLSTYFGVFSFFEKVTLQSFFVGPPGPLSDALGALLGALWTLLADLGDTLGRSWDTFGCAGASFGRSGVLLGALGTLWGVLEPLWDALGPSWVDSGWFQGQFLRDLLPRANPLSSANLQTSKRLRLRHLRPTSWQTTALSSILRLSSFLQRGGCAKHHE